MDSPKPSDTLRSTEQAVSDTANSAQTLARDTVRNAGKAGESATKDAGESARDGLERASSGINAMASRSLDIGSQAMGAYVEAGKLTSAKLADANKVLTENYSRSLSNYSELAQKAAGCRTVQDVIQLQTEALQKLHDNFDTMNRFYGLVMDAFTQSLQPIAAAVEKSRDQIQRAAPAM